MTKGNWGRMTESEGARNDNKKGRNGTSFVIAGRVPLCHCEAQRAEAIPCPAGKS